MLTVDEALQRVMGHIPTLGLEEIRLFEGVGRIAGRAEVSKVDIPAWDNSAMDGYALCAADLEPHGEVALRVNEVIAAGSMPERVVESGTASAIMTGAPMPSGADTVVMVENTDGAQNGLVTVRGGGKLGQHIRRRGEVVRTGDGVLEVGDRLTPGRLGLLAATGHASVVVRRKPVVAVLSTGDEVIAPGLPLAPGQIYSSNNVALCGLVQEAGCIPRDLGNAPDRLDELVARLEACLEADVVLTTGGVSMGVYDLVRDAFGRVGAEMDFWKVRMKPGKPLAYGLATRHGRTVPLFGLPGNPVSCMVNFLQFARPVLRRALGDPRPFLPVVSAIATADYRSRPGRARLVRVTLQRSESGFVVCPTNTQSSGAVTSMALAQGLALLDTETPGFDAGDTVRVQVLDAGFLDGVGPDYGW